MHDIFNLLFLDMDGVLNTKKSRFDLSKYLPPGNIGCRAVDPTCVKILEELVKETNSKIVISSSWRSFKYNDLDLNIPDELKVTGSKTITGNKSVVNALEFAGFTDCRNYILGNTKRLSGFRGFEIHRWLVENNHLNTPYIILDDESDFTNKQKRNHLIKTNSDLGLTKIDSDLAKHLLLKQLEI